MQQNSEQKQLTENIIKNETVAKEVFPNEQWLNVTSINPGRNDADFEIPKNIENIKVAKSRLTPTRGKQNISENDARILAKEIRQAKVLTDRGAFVYILPKMKNTQGRYIPGPDALVNGILYEFKTVEGSLKRFETRFRESREQGQNVFIRVMRSDITKNDVIRKMYSIINDPKYTGGYKGNLIFSVRQGNFENVYYVQIRDLKK